MPRKPHLKTKKARNGRHYWSLIAANGKIIADGAEGYSSASKARRGFKNVQRICRNV